MVQDRVGTCLDSYGEKSRGGLPCVQRTGSAVRVSGSQAGRLPASVVTLGPFLPVAVFPRQHNGSGNCRVLIS